MKIRRSNLLYLLFWMCFFVLAIRPVERIDEGFEWALSPLRALAEPALPLVWANGRSVQGAESGASGATDYSAEAELLGAELLRLARPTEPELVEGRDLVPAVVVGRDERNSDRLFVRVTDTTALVPDLPVVHGNTYVGRVTAVDHARLEVAIDLVTGPDFAVGAHLVDSGTNEAIWMAVGGVFSDKKVAQRAVERLALVVRNPSDREAPGGPVVVDEFLKDIDPYALLAKGYGLGTLDELVVGQERKLFADLDYGAGIFHVHILCPAGSRAGAVDELELAISDPDWRPTRRLSVGDPSSWRGGVKVAAGRAAGVVPGAALISNLALVGRVERAGEWSSDVRLLSDPGLSLVAVARLEGALEPLVLGRLISLGADDSGEWIRFRWEAVVGVSGTAPSDGELEGRVFTGAGDTGLPAGLFVGEARLVPSVDPEVGAPLVFVRVDRATDLDSLWVRTSLEVGP